MENASKALIIAGGVLIAVLVVSLQVYLFADFGATAARINAENVDKQLLEFNARFTSYADKEVTIHDIITVAHYAIENNKYYEGVDENLIHIYLNGADLTSYMNENELINADKNAITTSSPSLPKYICKSNNLSYHSNGRIKTMTFIKL